ncbi:DUF3089 domain-containing protein [Sphingobium sufflavum]|uniref:DUF3089 domain-containing protein n=1 Tax=Sphingobium sufflavum TaxID=1129547 RepID=UPI001F1D0DD3|nr:DUF3089 domain-containing protein [Sphingobium sufflavum]MCE7796797.1 DUF3089 domain-containing protein [Sphingobium sufflavum]
MARKFLFLFAGLIVLVIVAASTYRLWGDRLLRVALVPGAPFSAPAPRTAASYTGPALWYDHGTTGAAQPTGADVWPARPAERQAATFFVHPTSYIDRGQWNAPDGDKGADDLARTFIGVDKGIFAAVGPFWAPRYRQATFGSFLTEKPEAEQALDAAYGDVAAAFDAFLAANPTGPIILAGHSQGARHLMRLLADKVAGKPVASRIVAAYLVGWPISTTADLPALGLPACTRADQPGCILSWQSFAAPAGADYILKPYDAGRGLTGQPRRGSPMLCVNPLTGTSGPAPVPAAANQGMAKREQTKDGKDGALTLVRPGVGATCSGAQDWRGLLLIDGEPDLGPYVLPGNNYHVYDYMLFWANVQTDAGRRLDAFWKR